MAIINDGHPTTITFAGAPSAGLSVAEKEVTPPGYDGGGENDTTTMLNVLYRTKAPKILITLSEASFLAAYATLAYTTLLAQLNVNQLITITFADGSTLAFYGWMDKFIPNAITGGEQPTAQVTIVPSNQTGGVETAPVHSP